MPTTYTHDLFGKLVYRKLPANIQKVIREHGDLYRIGLHGPDILFYDLLNKKVNGTGIQMHKEIAREFFINNLEKIRKTKDQALLAYILGFGCHYLLDSTCHPTVNEMADKGVISHTLSEKELDRTLMIRTGRNPLTYYPSDCIVPKPAYAEVIHKAIPSIPAPKILWSLKLLKLETNMMVPDNHGRRKRALAFFGKLIYGKADEVLEHFMEQEPVKGSEEPVETLLELFEQALKEAPKYVEEMYCLAHREGTLSDRFDRTYNG